MAPRIRITQESCGGFHLEAAKWRRWQPLDGTKMGMSREDAEEEISMWLSIMGSLQREPDLLIEGESHSARLQLS